MSSQDDEPGTQRCASAPCMAAEVDPIHCGAPSQQPLEADAVARWRRSERDRLRAERLGLSAEARAIKARSLADHLNVYLAGCMGDLIGRVVSGYWPIKGELDLRFWLARVHEQGAIIALPVVETPGHPLAFRHWYPAMRMERGHWNIPVPPAASPKVKPEVCLAPVVGWDALGYRLGYGGGYFDRTLAALSPSPLVVGVGLQSARLDSIVPQPHDLPMSAILTEAGVQYDVEGSH